MAGDWIKMRVWLARDPKVIRMAKWLMDEPQFVNPLGLGGVALDSHRRNVTVALCVTGLLVTWGTAREQGDRVGDDLVLQKSDLSTLDVMTDMPHFGRAMAYVDWAREIENEALCFPNFFKDNESPDNKHKRQNAERQARFRNAHRNDMDNVTSNVTVTTEKRRGEKSKDTSLRSVSARKKLDAPTDEHERIAAEQGVSCKAEFEKYRDWVASKGRPHKDEVAGFRNWLRNAKQRGVDRREQQARNMDILTGKVRGERTVEGFAERVGGAVVLSLPGGVREPGADDVEGGGPERSAAGMGRFLG